MNLQIVFRIKIALALLVTDILLRSMKKTHPVYFLAVFLNSYYYCINALQFNYIKLQRNELKNI